MDALIKYWPVLAGFVGLVAWSVKLQQKSERNSEKISKLEEKLKDNELSIDKVEQAFRRSLYDASGQSIYMPRAGCTEKADKCFVTIRSLHNSEMGALQADILRIEKKLDQLLETKK